ncbi:MAG TPA: hypothetical protein VGQ15_17100 [Gaiellaceae bacterium]|nr:hypothetical protein [Gaiellaceae bacterium]
MSLGRERDGYAERGSSAGDGLGGDAAAVRLRDRGDDRQAEADAAAPTRPRLIDAVEPLEDALGLLGGQARAGVGDLNERAAVVAYDAR